MIAFDTSVLIDFIKHRDTEQTRFLNHLIEHDGEPVIPPIVVTELMSEPSQNNQRYQHILYCAGEYEIHSGYWERAGQLRAKLRAAKLKANTADALIAQFCIDHQIPLCTTDKDFRHYAKHGGLTLV